MQIIPQNFYIFCNQVHLSYVRKTIQSVHYLLELQELTLIAEHYFPSETFGKRYLYNVPLCLNVLSNYLSDIF